MNTATCPCPREAGTPAEPLNQSDEAIQAVCDERAHGALRVVCADDHAGFLRSVVETIEHAGMRVVGISSTGLGAVETIREVSPDVAVLDFRMPGLTGIEVALLVRDRFPATRTVILSAYDDPELIQLARQAGAAAFITKDSHPEEIVDAVRRAAHLATP
jgi:two-component system nitrate/nitrite response regulator NarL